jgi:hypothetical protein
MVPLMRTLKSPVSATKSAFCETKRETSYHLKSVGDIVPALQGK